MEWRVQETSGTPIDEVLIFSSYNLMDKSIPSKIVLRGVIELNVYMAQKARFMTVRNEWLKNISIE